MLVLCKCETLLQRVRHHHFSGIDGHRVLREQNVVGSVSERVVIVRLVDGDRSDLLPVMDVIARDTVKSALLLHAS